MSYLANITAYLPHSSQELDCCHPFLCTQSSLSNKVVHMGDQPFEDVGQASIWALRVDADSVLSDVVGGQVLHRRWLRLRGIHIAGVKFFCFLDCSWAGLYIISTIW